MFLVVVIYVGIRLLLLRDANDVTDVHVRPLHGGVDPAITQQLHHIADAATDMDQRRIVTPETGVNLVDPTKHVFAGFQPDLLGVVVVEVVVNRFEVVELWIASSAMVGTHG